MKFDIGDFVIFKHLKISGDKSILNGVIIEEKIDEGLIYYKINLTDISGIIWKQPADLTLSINGDMLDRLKLM